MKKAGVLLESVISLEKVHLFLSGSRRYETQSKKEKHVKFKINPSKPKLPTKEGQVFDLPKSLIMQTRRSP